MGQQYLKAWRSAGPFQQRRSVHRTLPRVQQIRLRRDLKLLMPRKSRAKTRQYLTLACLAVVPWVWEGPHGAPDHEPRFHYSSHSNIGQPDHGIDRDLGSMRRCLSGKSGLDKRTEG